MGYALNGYALYDIIHNPEIIPAIQSLAKEKLVTLEVIQGKLAIAQAIMAAQPQNEGEKMTNPTSLKQIWQDYHQGDYRSINQLLFHGALQDIGTLEALAMLSIGGIEFSELPKMLLFSMYLKKQGSEVADDIIKQTIVRMSEADKPFHAGYKAAVDEIVASIPQEELRPLLENAVSEIDQYSGYRHDRTLLQKAAFELRSEIVKLLCEGGANINKLDKHGWCSLTIAMNKIKGTDNDKKEVVETLLAYNPDLYAGGLADQPIECAARNLSLWYQPFVKYASEHFVTPGAREFNAEMKVQVASAYHHASAQQLIDFYHDMGWNIQTLGTTLMDE